MTHVADFSIGPGLITPDGTPVELFRLLTPRGEEKIVHDALADGATILELGCGAGRMTRALAELGHQIVAVDESPDMLRHVPGEHAGVRITKVHATIQELDLGAEFDAVLLASNLLTTFPAVRREFLGTCRRHVRAGGAVLIEKHDPAMFDAPFSRERGNRKFAVRDIAWQGRFVSATMDTHVGDQVWTRRVTVENLSDAELRGCLRESGLALDAYLTEDRTWVRAVPA
jgi:SAM-dependent methyltransferase